MKRGSRFSLIYKLFVKNGNIVLTAGACRVIIIIRKYFSEVGMKLVKKIVAALVAVCFVFSLVPASGAAAEDSVFYILPEDNAGLAFSVGSYEQTRTYSYMFLPNTVDASCVVVRYKGGLSSVTGDAVTSWDPTAKKFTVDATNECSVNAGSWKLTFMRSSIPSMYITLNEGESLDTINADKEARIGATAGITGTDGGTYDLAPAAIEMKTRGNTTFWPDKKPYQIKFDKKMDLFGMGKAKKWILLANYYDGTMIRTKVFFDLAKEIGMDDAPDSVFLDLYIDGDYRGVYQLTEKIEIGSSRIDLKDEKGVILEMESAQRIGEETDPYFRTSLTGKPFVYKDTVKSFDITDIYALMDINVIRAYIENYINTFESAIYAQDTDWDTISSMIDVDSFILYYFLNEYGEQVDCTYASTYFYMDGEGDVLHCGPVWDFDRVCGFNDPVPKDTDYVKNITYNVDQYRVEWFKELFRNPEFVARANELYGKVIKKAFDTDKVNDEIDRLQTILAPSLRMNHVKWVVFYDRCYTTDELVSGSTDVLVKYITDHIKGILSDKKAYMDVSYGSVTPTLSYTPYQASGSAAKTYTQGCMTYDIDFTGLAIELSNLPKSGGIEYSVNVGGTLYSASGGDVASSASFDKINAVYAHLTGEIADYFSVQYRVRIGDNWSAWASDGKIAGRATSGGRYYVKGIQMRLIQTAEIKLYDVGDVNGDGMLTIQDLQAIKGLIAGLDGNYIVESSDISGDGLITISDIAAMKIMLA